jgi:hypothetical protein
MAAWRLEVFEANASALSLATIASGLLGVMVGSATCTLNGSGFGIDMASWDYCILMFPFEVVWFERVTLLLPGLHQHLSSSSSWLSHVRNVPFWPLLSRHAYD